MIKPQKKVLFLVFFFAFIMTGQNFAQKKLFFINPETVEKNVIAFKTKNHYNYIGLAYLQKRGANYSLRFRTFLEKNPIVDFEITSFKTKENINFDFAIDNTSLYLTYQTPDSKVIYQKIDSIYSKPIFNGKKELGKDLKVYSLPSIYKFGKSIYILYHKESVKNKLDIELQTSHDGVNFSEPFNFTESLGYAVYPKLFLLSDKIGITFQGRPQTSKGRIFFEIFYYQLNLEGNQVLMKEQITSDIGDNFLVDGALVDGKVFITWENRLNNWRIMFSFIDLRTGKVLLEPRILTSNYYNYRKPKIIKFGEEALLFVQKVESRADRLFYYYFTPDGRISEEFDSGHMLQDYSIAKGSGVWLFYLNENGDLILKEADRTADMIKLTQAFRDKEIFSSNNFNIQWEKIKDGSGITNVYYSFDRSPNTIPDEISKVDAATDFVNIYAPDDGTWYFHIYYEDNAGNKSPVLHKKMIINTKAPIVSQIDFSGNEMIDLDKNLLANTNNINIKWNYDENIDYYLYSVSMYPKFFSHTAQTSKENKITIPYLKPGRYYFYIQPVNKAGIKGELKTANFFVKEFVPATQFFDPTLTGGKPYIVRETVYRNINLIPFKPYLNQGSHVYYVVPFWDLPVQLKLKVVSSISLLFLLVSILYMLLFFKHRRLIFEYETIRKKPYGKEIQELEIFKEGEIHIQPGIGESILSKMADEKKVKYKDLIARVEGLDQEIHRLEKEIKQKTVHGEEKPVIEARVVLEEAKQLEDTIVSEIIEDAEEVQTAEKILEERHKEEDIIHEAEEITEAQEIQEAETAEEISEAQEIGEAEEIEEADLIEEAEEKLPLERVNEISEIKEPVKEKQEIKPEIKVEEIKPKVEAKESEEFKEKIKLTLKYSFLITILVMFTIGAGSLISGYFTLKNSKENLSKESLKRAEVAIKSLAANSREPIRVADVPLIIESIVNTKAIEDILYTQVIFRDLDINDGQTKWFYRDNTGAFNTFDNTQLINETLQDVNKTQSAILDIQPDFDINNLLDKYTLYFPIIAVKDKNFQLTEKDFGQKFLGIARIDFSTARIFELLDTEKNQIFRITLIIAFIMIALGIIGAVFLSYMTVKPVKQLVEGVKIVAAGNLENQIPITTHDEIGRLTFEFNKMTTQLKNAQDEIIKKKVLEEQFSIAEGIQRSLIPKENLLLNEIEVTGFYKAALGVGGDYFDFFNIDKDRVGVIISDVSGKGVPAALMMVVIRTIFKTYVKRPNTTPKEIVSIINNVLAEDISNDMFASLFFFTYNKKTREVIFCNAGHGPLTYYSAKEKQVKTVISRTMPIGVMADNPNYTDQKVKMEKGDIILVFTDGVTEAMNLKREEFSEEKLSQIVADNSQLSAQEINQTIIKQLNEFVGEAPQHDDISMIVAKVR